MEFISSAERVWYATGFDPRKVEQWGGLEKIAKVLPSCFMEIKKSCKIETEENHEELAQNYSSFCSVLITDLYDSFKEEDLWKNHSSIKPVKDSYDKYSKLSRYSHSRGMGFHCCFGESLILMTCAAIGASLGPKITIKTAYHFTQDPLKLGYAGCIGGLAGFIIGALAIPVMGLISESIYELRPSIRKKRERIGKNATANFIKSIDDYIIANSSI